jgi:hypothetical protein
VRGDAIQSGFNAAPRAAEVTGLRHPGRAFVENKTGFRRAFGSVSEYTDQKQNHRQSRVAVTPEVPCGMRVVNAFKGFTNMGPERRRVGQYFLGTMESGFLEFAVPI